MASLPQPLDHNWDVTLDRGAQLAAESADASSNHSFPTESQLDFESEEALTITINEDCLTPDVSKLSASEEQLQEADTELKWLISYPSAHTDVFTAHMVLTFIQTLWYTHAPRPVPVDWCFTMTVGLTIAFFFYCISFALLWTSPEKTINDL